jgi:hypothetical protein
VQVGGVFHHQLDDELTFYLDPDRLLAFGATGEQPLMASYHPDHTADHAADHAGH